MAQTVLIKFGIKHPQWGKKRDIWQMLKILLRTRSDRHLIFQVKNIDTKQSNKRNNKNSEDKKQDYNMK